MRTHRETDKLIATLRRLERGGASEIWIRAVALAGGSRDPTALLNAAKRLGARSTRSGRMRGQLGG